MQPVAAMNGHAKDRVVDALVRAVSDAGQHWLTGPEDVAFVTQHIPKAHIDDLHFTRAPAMGEGLLTEPGTLAVLCRQPVFLLNRHAVAVQVDHLLSWSEMAHLAVLDPESAITQLADGVQPVGDEHDGDVLASQLADLVQALHLERFVADGQHFVDEQDFRLHMDGDRKPQPHGHPRRVVLDRHVNEALQLGEADDVVEVGVHVTPAQPQDGAVQVDVLAPREVGVEAGPQLQQRG